MRGYQLGYLMAWRGIEQACWILTLQSKLTAVSNTRMTFTMTISTRCHLAEWGGVTGTFADNFWGRICQVNHCGRLLAQ